MNGALIFSGYSIADKWQNTALGAKKVMAIFDHNHKNCPRLDEPRRPKVADCIGIGAKSDSDLQKGNVREEVGTQRAAKKGMVLISCPGVLCVFA